ncbi:hypothetical protein [Mycobacterium paraintracellulare]|uniref:hypothetical protein n=1 Tax=Mycobacterium paraintracellulare TaxID=1138383 RepID=UPI0019166DCB|nr:hypothetical protein [Mycobacterium paraintracellulare]
MLPTFLPGHRDSFTAGPRINVTWFSSLSAVGEIGAGLILGVVGLRARRRAAVEPPGHPRAIA